MLRRIETRAVVSSGWSAGRERILRGEIDQHLDVQRRLASEALDRWFFLELLDIGALDRSGRDRQTHGPVLDRNDGFGVPVE